MPQPTTTTSTNIFAPSDNCIALIKHYEGYEPTAKHDEADRAGVYTGGWGSIMHTDGTPIRDGETLTQDQWSDILEWEVKLKATSVNAMTQMAAITQSMFDALVSFAYNLGIGALQTSTLLKKLKANSFDKSIYDFKIGNNGYGIPDSCEFLRWCRSNGKIQNGLLKRRTSEAILYSTGELKLL